MNWLRSLLDKNADIASLTAQRDAALSDKRGLEKKLNATEAKLFREIDGNREREDALKRELLAATSPQLRLPYREPLSGDTAAATGDELDARTVTAHGHTGREDAATDVRVEKLVKHFTNEAYETRGIQYGPADLEILRAKIRADLDEYADIDVG